MILLNCEDRGAIFKHAASNDHLTWKIGSNYNPSTQNRTTQRLLNTDYQ